MTRIYVAKQEGCMTSDYNIGASDNKSDLIDFDKREHNQNTIIEVYDSETCKLLFECDMLTNRVIWGESKCNCRECVAVE